MQFKFMINVWFFEMSKLIWLTLGIDIILLHYRQPMKQKNEVMFCIQ